MMKVYFVWLFLIIFIPGVVFGANSQSSGNNYEFATVDTDPGTDGYYTNNVNVFKKREQSKHHLVWFTISGTGSMTVTLQYKLVGDTAWSDYDTYTTTEYKLLDAGAGGGEYWRAIVKDDDYTSGSMKFGFTW